MSAPTFLPPGIDRVEPATPNLVFILTDQQRRDSMSCYGNDWIDTRHLNSLAEGSFVFENCYVTQPVCTPARASILTGLYPHTAGMTANNVRLPPEALTIAEMLPTDYDCAYFGKWHLGDDVVPQHGFIEWRSIDDFQRSRYSRDEFRGMVSDYARFLEAAGIEPPIDLSYEEWLPGVDLPEDLSQAAFLGNEAAVFLEGRRSNVRPFALFVSFFEPHPPYCGPLADLYQADDIPVEPSFLRRPTNGSAVNQARADHYLAGGLNPIAARSGDIHDTTTEAGWRRLRARYFSNVTLVDRNVGKILDALEHSGKKEETVVVFTSEHGEMAGNHGLLEKRCLYEEAARVPLLMRVPWLADTNTRVTGNVSQIDLVPTLLSLLTGEVPAHLQGEDRSAVLGGGASLERNDVFVQWNGTNERDLGTEAINRLIKVPWRSVVSGDRWKLNLGAADRSELYDLNTDPFEMNNRFEDAACRSLVRDLYTRIRQWQVRTGDQVRLPDLTTI